MLNVHSSATSGCGEAQSVWLPGDFLELRLRWLGIYV